MALCSKEKARFGTWRFILPPSPIKSPILRCERGAGRRQALKFDFINSWLMELNSDQQPTERDRKGTSCPSPATTY